MDYYASLFASKVSGGGGGSSITVEALNVSENGTYTAPEGKAYSPVNVNVSGGSSADYGTLVDGSINGVVDLPSATKIKGYGMAYLTNATGVKAPNVATIQTYGFTASNKIEALAFPSAVTIEANAFRQMDLLKTVDLGANITSIGNNCFLSSPNFDTLIIRKATVLSIANTGMFTGTKFASGGAGGTLYVPNALISSYQSATNWSTILGYANNQIKAIEGSIYENAYADGTPIS